MCIHYSGSIESFAIMVASSAKASLATVVCISLVIVCFLITFYSPDLNLKNDGGSAGHLRCGKGSTWEGGMRVPAIAWWSGKIGHNHTHQLGSSLDLFPTILKMVGVKSASDNKIDGVDLSSVLLKNKRNVKEYVQWNF